MKRNQMTFEAWTAAVDASCWLTFGLSVHDLPDFPSCDWYEAGVTPNVAAKRAVKAAGSDMGF